MTTNESACRPLPKIVVHAMGTLGDVNPMLALASELHGRGYRVVFLTSDQFSRQVGEAGLEFRSIGTKEEFETAFGDGRVWNRGNRSGMKRHWQEYHLPANLRAFAIVEALRQENSNLAILSLSASSGAALAAERFDLPWVEVSVSSVGVFGTWVQTMEDDKFEAMPFGKLLIQARRSTRELLSWSLGAGPARNALRVSLGLRRLLPFERNGQGPALSLALLPDWYLRALGEIPDDVIATGFPLSDQVDDESRARVDSFVEEWGNPLVFTPGSGVRNVRDFFFQAIDVGKILNLPCVILSPAWREVTDLMNPQVLGLDYVDLAHLLPKSRALIHHGGIGTCAQAIRAGVPQIIRPLQFDQFDNAHAIWKLGLGSFVLRESFDAQTCAQLLAKMLPRAPRMQSLKRYAASVRECDAIERSCERIVEALAAAPDSVIVELNGQSGEHGSTAPAQRVVAAGKVPDVGAGGPPPFFSVVIATRNRPEWLARALRSVTEQGWGDYEIVVVDDASELSYEGVLRLYGSRVVYSKLTRQEGVARARNHGISLASGLWVVFLDDDDEWVPSFLSQQRRLLEGVDDRVGFAWCNVCRQLYDETGRISATRYSHHRGRALGSPKLNSIAACVGAGNGLTVRHSCLAELGGFDESFTVGEDTELILKLLSNGWLPVVNESVGVIVHEHNAARLSGDFAAYEAQDVYGRLLERYGSYLRSHAETWAPFVGQAARVKYQHAGKHEGDQLAKAMLSAKPASGRTLWAYLRVRIFLARLADGN